MKKALFILMLGGLAFGDERFEGKVNVDDAANRMLIMTIIEQINELKLNNNKILESLNEINEIAQQYRLEEFDEIIEDEEIQEASSMVIP